jgi:hypothetical protein
MGLPWGLCQLIGMKIKIEIIALLVILAVSCKPKETTIVESKFDNGLPKRVCVYLGTPEIKNMIKETIYYPNKQVQVVGEYKNNKRNGKWVFYYTNGRIWSDGYFRDGLNDGKRLTYYENGRLRYEAYYEKGERIGKWRFYAEDGKFLKEVDYTAIKVKEKALQDAKK